VHWKDILKRIADPEIWGQYIALKSLYLSTELQGNISQKTVISVLNYYIKLCVSHTGLDLGGGATGPSPRGLQILPRYFFL
jgi:hypothetical protein